MREYKKDPAFGTVSVHRVQGHTRLFGSTVAHSQFISIKVHTAVRARELNRDWVHSDREIVEVWMSSVQFSEMLTSIGQGDGVPCTLHHYRDPETGQAVTVKSSDVPEDHRADKIHQEFVEETARVTSDLRKTVQKLKELLNGPPAKKSDLRVVEHDLEMVEQQLRADLPFIMKSFREKIEETVRDAKGEIEAFVASKIESTGLTALHAESTKLLGDGQKDI